MEIQDITLVRELQNGLKLETKPFLRLAKNLGITEEEVLLRIQNLLKSGVLRRLGVAVKPEEFGNSFNALVAWKVPEVCVEEVGTKMALIHEISHCYDRECPPGWPYNMFTMIHAKSASHFDSLVEKIKNQFKLEDYKILKSVRELKKTSMRYFVEAEYDNKP